MTVDNADLPARTKQLGFYYLSKHWYYSKASMEGLGKPLLQENVTFIDEETESEMDLNCETGDIRVGHEYINVPREMTIVGVQNDDFIKPVRTHEKVYPLVFPGNRTVSEMVDMVAGEDGRVLRLIRVGAGVVVVMGMAWLKGIHSPFPVSLFVMIDLIDYHYHSFLVHATHHSINRCGHSGRVYRHFGYLDSILWMYDGICSPNIDLVWSTLRLSHFNQHHVLYDSTISFCHDAGEGKTEEGEGRIMWGSLFVSNTQQIRTAPTHQKLKLENAASLPSFSSCSNMPSGIDQSHFLHVWSPRRRCGILSAECKLIWYILTCRSLLAEMVPRLFPWIK